MSSLSLNPADPTRWAMVYPVYINGEKTIAKGRRINKQNAVSCPPPEIPEMLHVSQLLGLNVTAERKIHPRDFEGIGRLRVQLKNRFAPKNLK